MKPYTPPPEIDLARSAFIETLSDEFIATTGYGAYAYLNPIDIDRLFKQYLKHSASIRDFAKICVKSNLPV